MSDEVERLLEDSRAAGVFDSRGRFEIQGQQALAKLSRFTVAKPEEWILKMVQAAVAGGAQSLRITLGRRTAVLRFALAHLPSPEATQDAILSPELPSTPFLFELAIGLRSLLATRGFHVGWPAETGYRSLEWDGQKFREGTARSATPALELVVVYPSNWLTGSYLERAAESHILQTRAAYCPIPLFLDNREVTVHDLPMVTRHKNYTSNFPRHVACGYLGTPQSEPVTAVATRLHNPFKSKAPLIRWGRGERLVEGSFSFFCSHTSCSGYAQESFRLVWTRYGVECARHELADSPLGGFLQIPGDHLRADLGGLSLQVEDEDISQAKCELEKLSPCAEFAAKWLLGFQTKTTVAEILGYTAFCTVGLVLVVGICAMGAGEALGGLGGFGAGPSKTPDDFPAAFHRRANLLLQLANLDPDKGEATTEDHLHLGRTSPAR